MEECHKCIQVLKELSLDCLHSRRCDASELKAQLKQQILKLHPDKNQFVDRERATNAFQRYYDCIKYLLSNYDCYDREIIKKNIHTAPPSTKTSPLLGSSRRAPPQATRHSPRRSAPPPQATRHSPRRSAPRPPPSRRYTPYEQQEFKKKDSRVANKPCPSGQVRNPLTNRCITVGGKRWIELVQAGILKA